MIVVCLSSEWVTLGVRPPQNFREHQPHPYWGLLPKPPKKKNKNRVQFCCKVCFLNFFLNFFLIIIIPMTSIIIHHVALDWHIQQNKYVFHTGKSITLPLLPTGHSGWPPLTLIALAISEPPAPTVCASAAWLAACTLRG